MLRLSARRHAAASLSSFSHGPSSIPPEILFKYVTSAQLKASSLELVRESPLSHRWIDENALRSLRNSTTQTLNNDELQAYSLLYKDELKIDRASNPAKGRSLSRRGQAALRRWPDVLGRKVVALQSNKQHSIKITKTASPRAEIKRPQEQEPSSDRNHIAKSIQAPEFPIEQFKGKKRDSRGTIVESSWSFKASEAGSADRTEGLFVRMPFKDEEHSSLVGQFNSALAEASRAMYNDACRLKLWTEYTKLKEQFPDTLRHFPKAAWRRLWKIQASLRPTDTHRLGSLETLITHMEENSQYSIRAEKMVLYLEKEFASGRESEALAEWQSGCQGHNYKFRRHIQSEMGIESEKWKEWLELGVRLHALAGDTDQAAHITQQILRRYRTCDPRFILVQILAFNHWPDTALHRQAWILYLQLRQLPKFSLCLDDFQGLFHSFLRAGQKRCALGVLKDMMRLDIGDDILTANVLECVKALHESCTTEAELERYSISALSVVPTRLQTNALYTSWLARTCKHGSGDDMARVIELMFERGLVPTANHLDGLLKAWLQSSDPDAVTKGERLAWTMISTFQNPKEIDLLKYLRLSRLIADSKAGTRSGYDPRIFTSRPISKATANTFIRLARHYAEMGDADHARDVIALFMSTEIEPTRRQLRAILLIYINTGYFSRAWQFFQECVANDKLPIDLATYSTLWQGLSQQLHRRFFLPKNLRTTVDGIPPPRELFLHMQDFIRTHGPISTVPHTRAFKRRLLPKNVIPLPEAIRLLDRVVRAFALSKDTFGALVAMRALYHDVDITPSVTTIITILQHAAHEAMVSECKIQNRPQNVKEYMPMSMQVLASLYQFSDPAAPIERAEAVKELLQPSIQRKGVGLLNLLETFMARIMQGNFSNKQIMAKLGEARESMGLLPRKEGGEHNAHGNEFSWTPAMA